MHGRTPMPMQNIHENLKHNPHQSQEGHQHYGATMRIDNVLRALHKSLVQSYKPGYAHNLTQSRGILVSTGDRPSQTNTMCHMRRHYQKCAGNGK